MTYTVLLLERSGQLKQKKWATSTARVLIYGVDAAYEIWEVMAGGNLIEIISAPSLQL